MDRCTARRAAWPDEDLELERVPFDQWLMLVDGLCARCGWEGHGDVECPNVQPWMLR